MLLSQMMNYKELCLLVAVLAALFNTILSLLFKKKKKKRTLFVVNILF